LRLKKRERGGRRDGVSTAIAPASAIPRTVNFEYDALHRLLRKKYGVTIVSEYTTMAPPPNNTIGR